MKIAIVVSSFPPYAGGMGNAAAAHARLLRERGHEVAVFSPQTSRARFHFGHAALLPDAVRRAAEFDVVLLEYPFFGTAEPLLLSSPWDRGRMKVGDRVVVYYHMDVIGRGLLRPLFAMHRRFVLPRVMRSAHRILVSSFDYARTSLLSSLPCYEAWECEGRIVKVPLGVDTKRFTPGTPRGGSNILFVGALDRQHYFKRLPVLLRALADVPHATLMIVGDGDMRLQYERLAQRRGIAGRVTFRGRVGDDELPSVYRASDVLVLPSTDQSEAFGTVLLEAQACGVPVIASDLPGVRTAFEDGKTGLRVPPGDVASLASAITSLLDDPARRRSMGAAAREYVTARFDEKIVGDRLNSVMLSLPAGRQA